MTDSFWTGGPEAYYDGVKAHYKAKLDELNAVLVHCEDQLERREVKQLILTFQAEFKEKLKGSCRLIF